MQVNLHNFKLLHNHLMSILSTNNYQSQHLPEKIMQYIGMIVESQKHQDMAEDFFDYFCQNAGNKIIKLTLEVEPLLSVKVLSMLFINLKSQYWVSYLLCQPFINDAIQFEDIPKEQQWPQYYISLLKSLSIRLNSEQLSLFYNKKFSKFPLLYEALKYYNHPDCMVRTNVMNIILGIMKIKNPRLSRYFGRFPFTSYVLTYCCQVKERITKLNSQLEKTETQNEEVDEKTTRSAHKSIVKMYYIDIIDYICYLNDLIELGSEELAYFVRNAVLVYIVLPTLKYLKEDSPSLCICSTIFLIFTLFKTISDQTFKQTLCLLLMGKRLPASIHNKINNKPEDEVYVPKVYSEQFLPSKYYWNKFDYQIENECAMLFDDVTNFQTEHESKKEDPELTAEFMVQINKISHSLGFNILKYESYEDRVPLSELSSLLGFQKQKKQHSLSIIPKLQEEKFRLLENPIRQSIFKILSSSILDITKDSVVLCIASIMNNFTTCEDLNNNILKFCGLLMPHLDLVNYKEEFNITSMDMIRDIGIKFLQFINKNFKQNVKENNEGGDNYPQDGCWFSLPSIKNIIILINDSLYKKLQRPEEQNLIDFYRNSVMELKELITKRNMKKIVQNFEVLYSKIGKQTFVHSNSLPQSVLVPRKSARQVESDDSSDGQDLNFVSRLYFKDSKEKVKYFIEKFSVSQTFLFKYMETYITKQQQVEDFKGLHIEKYNVIYATKYSKIQQQWKLGNNYEIGFRHMVECQSQQRKTKNTKKFIIVQDKCNLIIVEPSREENSARIVVNHPWKYVQAEIDRQTGKNMAIKLSQCVRGDTRINIFFDNEASCAGTLQWMNSLKYERYQSQQAFILSYLKQCLGRH